MGRNEEIESARQWFKAFSIVGLSLATRDEKHRAGRLQKFLTVDVPQARFHAEQLARLARRRSRVDVARDTVAAFARFAWYVARCPWRKSPGIDWNVPGGWVRRQTRHRNCKSKMPGEGGGR